MGGGGGGGGGELGDERPTCSSHKNNKYIKNILQVMRIGEGGFITGEFHTLLLQISHCFTHNVY